MELRKRVLEKLAIFLKLLLEINTNEVYVDSTPIKVCYRKRRKNYKTLNPCATSACSTMGKFFCFKLHIEVYCLGNIFDFKFTPGSLDDRKALENLLRNFTGTVFGDKGYISKSLKELLSDKSINLVTRVRKNMKPQELSLKIRLYIAYDLYIDCISNAAIKVTYYLVFSLIVKSIIREYYIITKYPKSTLYETFINEAFCVYSFRETLYQLFNILIFADDGFRRQFIPCV